MEILDSFRSSVRECIELLMDVWPLPQLSRLTSWANTGHDGIRWSGQCDCDTALYFCIWS